MPKLKYLYIIRNKFPKKMNLSHKHVTAPIIYIYFLIKTGKKENVYKILT